MSPSLLLFFIFILLSCDTRQNDRPPVNNLSLPSVYKKISDIPVPDGYYRTSAPAGSMITWLRELSLKSDKRVFLYNGKLKTNQSAQFAVLDITVGKQDLQQCADAAIRLRAEWLIDTLPASISFLSTSGQEMSFPEWRRGIRYRLSGQRLEAVATGKLPGRIKEDLAGYLSIVFQYAGTRSLHQQMRHRPNPLLIRPGDVYLQAGSPGHAMTVADFAHDRDGNILFLLAQSYMPAQDIHIVRNPAEADISPWFRMKPGEVLHTPEWDFAMEDLYEW